MGHNVNQFLAFGLIGLAALIAVICVEIDWRRWHPKDSDRDEDTQ